jgi:PAS domain-containing protein
MVLFTIFAGVIGCLVGNIKNQAERHRELEAMMTAQRDRMLKIIDGMADGIIITGPDYRIRFLNSRMVKEFGDGAGIACYEHLHKVNAPCQPDCKILDVIRNEEVGKWECSFPDGRTYEVLAAPYVDSDGVTCQISIFRDITKRKKT